MPGDNVVPMRLARFIDGPTTAVRQRHQVDGASARKWLMDKGRELLQHFAGYNSGTLSFANTKRLRTFRDAAKSFDNFLTLADMDELLQPISQLLAKVDAPAAPSKRPRQASARPCKKPRQEVVAEAAPIEDGDTMSAELDSLDAFINNFPSNLHAGMPVNSYSMAGKATIFIGELMGGPGERDRLRRYQEFAQRVLGQPLQVAPDPFSASSSDGSMPPVAELSVQWWRKHEANQRMLQADFGMGSPGPELGLQPDLGVMLGSELPQTSPGAS